MNRVSHRALGWLSVALFLLAAQLTGAEEKTRPIVDARFDGPFRQIESSTGDEWAPTWGREDVLYTGNDDGTSFGGIPQSNIAFGKLEGTSPDGVVGSTVNAMADFREPLAFGPEVALWQAVDTLTVGTARYRFAACVPDGLDRSCVARSSDEGTTWTPVGAAPLAHGSRFGAPSFLSFGQLESLFGDVGTFVYATSYAGVEDSRDVYYIGRTEAAKLESGGYWSFLQKDGSWGPLASASPFPNSSRLGPDGANWKVMNAYAVDGALYMFVTRCVYPRTSEDPERRHWWKNASIVKSTDGGKTWTRASKDNYEHPMFPGHRFATPYFVWYGKDGAASVDNADKYIYAVSNNGFFENGDDYILGRVLRPNLPALSSADWSFYRGGDGMQDGSWTPSANAAKPILLNSRRSSMTGMTYIPALGRYVMVVWHYHSLNFEQAIRDKDLGTVLEFFEAAKPWGPWTKVKTFDTGKLGWYTPIIGQRFQKSVDADTVIAILYATGFTSKPEGGLDPTLYKLDYMPITLSTRPLEHNDPTFVGGR
jgi:hypothetical protein